MPPGSGSGSGSGMPAGSGSGTGSGMPPGSGSGNGVTELTEPALKGTMLLEIGSAAGFGVGDKIHIGDDPADANEIQGIGSFLLSEPLRKTFPKGTVVRLFGTYETESGSGSGSGSGPPQFAVALANR